MTLDEILKYAKAAASGAVGSAMGWPMDTAVGAANLSRAAYGYGGHKLGLLNAAQMPEPIDPKNVPGTSARLSGLLGVGDSTGEAIAEFAGGLLSPGQKKPPKKMDWTAYHGSPHKFDKFSLDKIGTGEGAQAYGHGLYFADNKDTADYYRSALSKDVTFDGKPLMKSGDMIGTTGDAKIDNMVLPYLLWGMPVEEAAKSAAASGDPALAKKIMEAAPKFKASTGGSLYKVDIDDKLAPKDAFLDWDKPLSQQGKVGEKVAKAFGFNPKQYTGQAAVEQIPQQAMVERGMWEKMLADAEKNDPRLEKINYIKSQLHQLSHPQAFASAKLKELGIPGIRYLDAGSRSGGGTYNTVLFDDALVKILERQ